MFSKVVDVTNHCVCSHVAGFIASMLVFLKARIHREYARLPQDSLDRFARSPHEEPEAREDVAGEHNFGEEGEQPESRGVDAVHVNVLQELAQL